MNIKVVVFDLDDTLYEELTYVKSGFHAVAKYLSEELKLSSDMLFAWMCQRLQTHGRGTVFNDVLHEFGGYSKARVKKSLSVYRLHKPNIVLPKETVECLEALKTYALYIVTDGNKIVQHNKLCALGVHDKVKHCYVTHRYGVKHAKPSPYCFHHIIKKEKVDPNQVVYIGDNPRKDFVGIKPLGFHTIRIMTGDHRNLSLANEYEADFKINSLVGLPTLIQKGL